MAHELGHHELHRQGASPVLITDKDIFGRRDSVEQEANAFAGHLLIPDPAIVRTLDEWQATKPTAETVARLMQRFGVSYEVAVFRLHNSGRINASQRDTLQAAKRRIGVRALCDAVRFNEFIDYPLPTSSLPPSFESDVLTAYAAGAIADRRLADLMRVADTEHARERARAAGVEPDDGELSDDEFEALLEG